MPIAAASGRSETSLSPWASRATISVRRRSLETRSRAAGRTVVLALASLILFPQRFLCSMGIGGALVALAAAAIVLVLLPALLSLRGRRLASRRAVTRHREGDAMPLPAHLPRSTFTAVLTAAAVGAAAAPGPAAAQTARQERLQASVTQPTADRARAVGITVERDARPADGSRPRNATAFLFGIPRGFVIDAGAFPTTMPGGPVVTRFVIRIDRRTTTEDGRRVALVHAPRTCPPRAWTFHLTSRFADAAAEVTRDRVRCRPLTPSRAGCSAARRGRSGSPRRPGPSAPAAASSAAGGGEQPFLAGPQLVDAVPDRLEQVEQALVGRRPVAGVHTARLATVLRRGARIRVVGGHVVGQVHQRPVGDVDGAGQAVQHARRGRRHPPALELVQVGGRDPRPLGGRLRRQPGALARRADAVAEAFRRWVRHVHYGIQRASICHL